MQHYNHSIYSIVHASIEYSKNKNKTDLVGSHSQQRITHSFTLKKIKKLKEIQNINNIIILHNGSKLASDS